MMSVSYPRRILLVAAMVSFLAACSNSAEPEPINLAESSVIDVAPTPTVPTVSSEGTVDSPVYTMPTAPSATTPSASVMAKECADHLNPVRALIKKARSNVEVSEAEVADMNERLATALDHCSNTDYLMFLEEMYPPVPSN